MSGSALEHVERLLTVMGEDERQLARADAPAELLGDQHLQIGFVVDDEYLGRHQMPSPAT